jgi:hypothetical protein
MPRRASEQVKAAPGGTRLDGSRSGGPESWLTTRSPESVEIGKAKTSVRDARQTDVRKTKEVAEAPQDAGKEEEQSELQIEREKPQRQLQQQQHGERPLEWQPRAERGELDQPVGEAEREVAMLPPDVQAEALADRRLVPPQGSTSAVINLTVDDPPSDKGKQKADVEMVDAPDRPRTSVAPEDDMAEASAKWPDFAELAFVRAEEELPRWGRSTLEFWDAANPNAEPFFALNDRDEVQHWEYIEGLRKHFVQSLQMVANTLVRQMSEAFEVSRVCYFIWLVPPFALVLTLSLAMVRSSRSDHAASHYSSATRAVCGRRFRTNGLWSRRPTSGCPRRAPRQMSFMSSLRRLRKRRHRHEIPRPKPWRTWPRLERKRPRLVRILRRC